ncbi:MAG: hypothetical protein WD669_06250 [Pirellulales bacterium]
MKTTVEVPDRVYRQIKARAASRGQTIKAFVLDALQDKLAKEKRSNGRKSGWRAVFGKAKKADVEAVQRAIDEKFSLIHLEDWQ